MRQEYVTWANTDKMSRNWGTMIRLDSNWHVSGTESEVLIGSSTRRSKNNTQMSMSLTVKSCQGSLGMWLHNENDRLADFEFCNYDCYRSLEKSGTFTLAQRCMFTCSWWVAALGFIIIVLPINVHLSRAHFMGLSSMHMCGVTQPSICWMSSAREICHIMSLYWKCSR